MSSAVRDEVQREMARLQQERDEFDGSFPSPPRRKPAPFASPPLTPRCLVDGPALSLSERRQGFQRCQSHKGFFVFMILGGHDGTLTTNVAVVRVCTEKYFLLENEASRRTLTRKPIKKLLFDICKSANTGSDGFPFLRCPFAGGN